MSEKSREWGRAGKKPGLKAVRGCAVRRPGYILVLFLVALFCHPLYLFAKGESSLQCDLLGCIRQGIEKNPAACYGKALTAQAAANLKVVQANRNPDITAQGENGYFSGTSVNPSFLVAGISPTGFPIQSRNGGYVYGIVSGSAPIFDQGAFRWQVSHSERSAQLGISEAAWTYEDDKMNVAQAVSSAYETVLKDRETVSVLEKVTHLALADYQTAQAKFQKNLISRTQLLQAEVTYTQFKSMRDKAIETEKSDQQNLALLIGADRSAKLELAPLPDFGTVPVSLEVLTRYAQEHNSSIKAQKFKVMKDQEQVEGILSQKYPVLSVQTSYGSGKGFVSGQETREAFVGGLAVNVPIFDFGRINSKADYARAQVKLDESSLRQLELQTNNALQQAFYSALEQKALMKLADKRVEQTREAMRLSEAEYAKNLIPIGTYHDSIIAWMNAKLARFQMGQDYLLDLLRIRMLCAGKWNDTILGPQWECAVSK